MGFAGQMAWVSLALLMIPMASLAQQVRPSDERPELKDFPPPDGLPSPLRLPPLAPPPRLGRVSSGQAIAVRELRVVGSTVLSPGEIASVTQLFENRELYPADLQDVRDRLTRLYIDRGYVTSG